MAEQNGAGGLRGPNVPDLGKIGMRKPTHGAAQTAALMRHLNDKGGTPLVDGKLPREAYLDATDLLTEIRAVVCAELQAHGIAHVEE